MVVVGNVTGGPHRGSARCLSDQILVTVATFCAVCGVCDGLWLVVSAALIDFLPARRSVPISVIGLDVGTSGSRAVVVEAERSISASATAPHDPFASPGPAWAEQDPDNWWTAGQQALRVVTGEARARGSSIDAVGLSGQMHGAVLLGERGEVLRPSIIWCDQRTSAECRVAGRARSARVGCSS